MYSCCSDKLFYNSLYIRIRGDLNKAILEDATSNVAEEVDNTLYYNPKSEDDSTSSSDEFVGAAIDTYSGNQ